MGLPVPVIEADYEEVDASMLQTTKRIIHEDVRSDAARVEYGKLDLKTAIDNFWIPSGSTWYTLK